MSVKPFYKIVEECIERMQSGDTVENCIADYPHHADKLRHALQTVNQIQTLPVQYPSAQANLQIKQKMRAAIAQQHRPQNTLEDMMKLFQKFGLAAAASVALIFLAVWGISALLPQSVEPAATIPLDAKPTQEPATVAPVNTIVEAMQNISVPSNWAPNGMAQLNDGEFELTEDRSPEEVVRIHLDAPIVTGDLNDDGVPDVVTTLVTTVGTEIQFVELLAVVDEGGEPVVAAVEFLGDGVLVNDLSINDGTVFLTIAVDGGEPITNAYVLDNQRLVDPAVKAAEQRDDDGYREKFMIEWLAGEQAPVGSYLTVDVLRNMAIPVGSAEEGIAQLEDGIYREMYATVWLQSEHAYGDLTGDGVAETAVILATSGGGSGTFYEMVVITENEGVPEPIGMTFLGDRVQIQQVQIQDGIIELSMITHGSDDSMCCPTEEVTQRYNIQAGFLLPVRDDLGTETAVTTKIIEVTPPVPTISRNGTCISSNILPHRAYRCFLDEGEADVNGGNLFDPCYVAADEETLVCGDQFGGTTFVLTPTMTLPTLNPLPRSVMGTAVQLEDGTVCNFVGGAGITFADKRLNYQCEWQANDQNDTEMMGIIGDLYPGDTTWFAELVIYTPSDAEPAQSDAASSGFELIQVEWVPLATVWR